jgi:hypothetical protein
MRSNGNETMNKDAVDVSLMLKSEKSEKKFRYFVIFA